MKPHRLFEVFEDRRRIYTKALSAKTFFEERTTKDKGQLYREWEPRRSKLGAMIMKGCTNVGIRSGDVVLYLGSSHGYTVSFVSDMVGEDGLIFALDPAPRVMRDLVFIAENRKNIAPVLADANHPEQYVHRVCQADIVFQDISQRNQLDIFTKNVELFLKEGGYGLLAVKARSIDIKRRSKDIFIDIRKQLEKKYKVIDYRILEPFQKDHCMIIIKKAKPEEQNQKKGRTKK